MKTKAFPVKISERKARENVRKKLRTAKRAKTAIKWAVATALAEELNKY